MPVEQLPPASAKGLGDQPTDHALLRRFRRGSQDAAAQLYFRYAQRMRKLVEVIRSEELAQIIDIEDILQSTFGSFFWRASQGYYDVPDGEELWNLLVVITLNKVRARANYFRAAKRDVRRAASGAKAERILAALETQADEAFAFLQLLIDDALERLPPDHRTIVELRIQGYEVAEIADQTGRAKRTVERILQEARKALDALFRED
jgi:RNA polymerase sigma-70 factor (ECF subfamily)